MSERERIRAVVLEHVEHIARGCRSSRSHNPAVHVQAIRDALEPTMRGLVAAHTAFRSPLASRLVEESPPATGDGVDSGAGGRLKRSPARPASSSAEQEQAEALLGLCRAWEAKGAQLLAELERAERERDEALARLARVPALVDAVASALTSLRTGPLGDGYAYAVLTEALAAWDAE